jgi:hypothetical protein
MSATAVIFYKMKKIIVLLIGIMLFPILNADVIVIDSGGENEILVSESGISLNEFSTLPFFSFYSVYPGAVVNGSDVNINMFAIRADSIWANITYPNSSVIRLDLTNNVTEIFSDTGLIGRYNVSLYVNDSFGNTNSVNTFFLTEEDILLQFNVVDENLTGIPVVLSIYVADTSNLVHEHNFTGDITDIHANLTYDLLFEVYNGSIEILLEDVDSDLNLNETIGIDRIIYNVTNITQEEELLVTYAINTTYNFSNATINVYYGDVNFTDEENLKLYKCDNWNFTSQVCLGGFVDITSNATQNVIDNYFSYLTSSFSGFSIFQFTSPEEPEPPIEPPVVIVLDEGRGGAGIGTPSIKEDETQDVTINPLELVFSIIFGETQNKNLTIINSLDRAINLGVSIEGDIKDIVSVQRSISLNKGTSKIINVEVGPLLKKSLLTGKLIFSSGAFIKEIPIILNVRSQNFLFDISTTILDEYRIVKSGEKILSQINLVQVGSSKEKIDIVVNYVIKDFSGNLFLEESETFFVLDEKSYVREFSTKGFPPGKYVLGLEVVYPGAFGTASSQFEVVKKRISPIYVAIFLCALLLLFFIIAKVLIKKGNINIKKLMR